MSEKKQVPPIQTVGGFPVYKIGVKMDENDKIHGYVGEVEGRDGLYHEEWDADGNVIGSANARHNLIVSTVHDVSDMSPDEWRVFGRE